MRRFLIYINIFIFFLLSLLSFACADSAPVDKNSVVELAPDKNINVNYQEPKTTPAIYYSKETSPKEISAKKESDDLLKVPDKKQEIKKEQVVLSADKKPTAKKENNIVVTVDKKTQKDTEKERNIKVDDSKNDRIISSSFIKISAIYPDDLSKVTNSFPGYRGTNQLVVYKRSFGKNTGTNEFGKEAVVEEGIVTKLTGANSTIPRNGYVISGHGKAKKWISDNLKIGTKIQIEDNVLKAYTTIDSYRYFAKHKIQEVEQILISTKQDYQYRDDKFIYYYLKKAKQQYKKSLKDNSQACLESAKESIESATLAYRYTLPFLSNELKGTWIRPTQKTIQEVQQTLDKIKETGINNVFLETYFHGRTIFPSKTMKDYGFEVQNTDFNYDALAVWIKEAHRRNIKVHVWFESFYVGNRNPSLNPKSILALQPDWSNKPKQKADVNSPVSHPQEHNGYFLDPANPEVQTFLLKLIAEISARYNVDGFNIDYVRYPNISKENFNNQWGYTKYAREQFYNLYGVDPVNISQKGDLWNKWCDYRTSKITDYIAKVSEFLRNRNITFSTVIFPDYRISLQTKYQDWTYWASKKYVDALTPLILTSDDELAYSMLEEIKKKAGSDVVVYPGLFAGFIESDPEDLLRQIHIIRRLRLQGVILFDWAHLNSNYLDVLKTSVFKNTNF